MSVAWKVAFFWGIMALPLRLGKKKKLSTDDALRRVNDLLSQKPLSKPMRRKRRKPTRFEITTDPQTGLRDFKGTYNPASRASSSQDAVVSSDVMFEPDVLSDENSVSDEETLVSAINNCRTLLDSLSNTKKVVTWNERMTSLQEDWTKGRSTIFGCIVSAEHLQSAKCSFCLEGDACVRCHQCGMSCTFCEVCDERMHSCSAFHDRELWNGRYFEPAAPMEKLDKLTHTKVESERMLPFGTDNCPSCDTAKSLTICCKKETVAVITTNGRFDFNKCIVKCSNCHIVCEPWDDYCCVIKNGYWPGSLKSPCSYIFQQDLFCMWDIFQKQMPGTSQKSFLAGLGEFSVQKGRNGVVNPTVFSVAFKEWKYCKYEVETSMGFNWMQCPCCEKEQHSCHVDGNMKLYRYKVSGKSRSKCYYGNIFIAERDSVESHLSTLYKNPGDQDIQGNRCGDTVWKAARNKHFKKAKLDETGLDIAGCRHSLAQFAVNMTQGELYGYAHYILTKKFLEKPVTFFWQDIICKFWIWAQKSDKNFSSYQIKPALSVMHAKAHNWTCQVLWGGRWQDGAACSTGEEVEQINSYFSRLGNTTKYMLPEGRDELLTECARAWNRRKINDMVFSLCKRYHRAHGMSMQSTKQLEELVDDLQLDNQDINYYEWRSEVQQVAREEDLRSESKTSLTNEEEYFLVCEHLHQVQIIEGLGDSSATAIGTVVTYQNMYRSYTNKLKDIFTIQNKIGDLEKNFGHQFDRPRILEKGKKRLAQRTLESLQTKIEMLYFSVLKKTSNISKLADTSKQRTKLRRKLISEREQMKSLLAQYCELQGNSSIDCSSAVVDGNFPWIENSRTLSSSGLPIRMKAMLVEKYMITERWKEEIELIKNEMERFLNFYSTQVYKTLSDEILAIDQQIESISTVDDAQCERHPYVQNDERDLNSINNVARYNVANVSSCYLFGMKALKKKGIDHCINQIHLGVEHFSKITLGDYSDMKECLVGFPSQMDDDFGVNSNFDWTNKSDSSDDDDDVDDDEIDSNFGTDSYYNLDGEFGT